MRKFDYSFLKNELLPARLMHITNSISELKVMERFRKEEYKDIFTALEKIAKIQSVKNSNAIEGIITTDKRIEEIVNNSSAPLNHDEMEIAGYRDALNLVHGNHEMLNINEQMILRLHNIMLSYADVPDASKYKEDDNVIMEVDQSGNRRIRFEPVSADETPKAMEQLVLAYREAYNDSNINQLLLVPCFILDFLCVHPFRDGNGRMSRLLSLLLLYKNGYEAGKYISYEEQINKMKGLYYEALKKSSSGWHENKNDYVPFIENFLMILYFCYKELDNRFGIIGSKKLSKKARIETALLKSLIPLSKNDIVKLLPDISPTTVEAVLAKMLNEGQIEKTGQGRSTKYFKKHN